MGLGEVGRRAMKPLLSSCVVFDSKGSLCKGAAQETVEVRVFEDCYPIRWMLVPVCMVHKKALDVLPKKDRRIVPEEEATT